MEKNESVVNISQNISELITESVIDNQTEPHNTFNTTFVYGVIIAMLFYFIYNYFGKSKKKTAKDTILIVGPSNSGKTSFFYALANEDSKKETVTSMDVNLLERSVIPHLEEKGNLDVLDIPGQGFFKTQMIDTLPNSKAIVLFVDSTEKESIVRAADYLYDILNNENFDDLTPVVIACNKQDLKFPKTKKVIESDLSNEVENIKHIKQKNNLEETSQMGALFSMKTKFSFSAFKNIVFVETDKSNPKKTTNIFASKKPPSITIQSYLERIVKYSKIEESTLIVTLIYIDRLCDFSGVVLGENNIHSILLAIKFIEDDYYSNEFYARVGGISLQEINTLELEGLIGLKHKLFIDEVFFHKYRNYLIHYVK